MNNVERLVLWEKVVSSYQLPSYLTKWARELMTSVYNYKIQKREYEFGLELQRTKIMISPETKF